MVQIVSTLLTASVALLFQVGRVLSADLASCNSSAGFDWVNTNFFVSLAPINIDFSHSIPWAKTRVRWPLFLEVLVAVVVSFYMNSIEI